MLDIVGRAKRAAFARKMTLQKKAAERAMARSAQAQLRRELSTAAKVYQNTGSTAEAIRAVDSQRFWWADYFRKYHTKIGNLSANQIFKGSEKGAEPPERKDFDQFKDKWGRIINTRGADKVVQITDTTKKSIKQAIFAGTQAGGSQYDIGKEIYNLRIGGAGTLNARARARTISRTESQFAYQGAAQTAAETIPFDVEKEWVTTDDEVRRDSHAAINGTRVAMKEAFKLEDPTASLMYPGDPTGPAAQVINCRCGVIYHRINKPKPTKPSKPKPGKPPPKPKPIEVTKRVYRPGKTKEEAASIAEDLKLTSYADYENINTEVANALNRSLVNSFNKYGDMLPRQRAGINEGKRMLSVIDSDYAPPNESWIAWVTTRNPIKDKANLKLTFSPIRKKKGRTHFTIDDYKDDWRKSRKAVENGEVPFSASGWLPGKITPQGAVSKIADHEFGHMTTSYFMGKTVIKDVHRAWEKKWKKKIAELKRKRSRVIKEAEGKFQKGEITYEQFMDVHKPGYRGEKYGWSAGKDLSRYAMTNPKEEFAEIWVLHSGGGDFLLPPDIVKLLEELQDIGTKLAKGTP